MDVLVPTCCCVQKHTYLCLANCHDNRKSRDELSQCMDRCRVPVESAEREINAEMSQFQSRMQRAIIACRDEADDRLRAAGKRGDEMTPAEQKKLETCLVNVLDNHIGMVGQVHKRLDATLKARLPK